MQVKAQIAKERRLFTINMYKIYTATKATLGLTGNTIPFRELMKTLLINLFSYFVIWPHHIIVLPTEGASNVLAFSHSENLNVFVKQLQITFLKPLLKQTFG